LGLYIKSFRKPLAGLISATSGLISTIFLNIYIIIKGRFDASEETYIIQWFGIEFLQEFIMYITVPISILGFFIGILIHKRIDL